MKLHSLLLIALVVTAGCRKSAKPFIYDISYSGNPATFRKVGFSSTVVNGSGYMWSFGDGTTSTEEIPIHTYTWSDSFTVTLIVNNDAAHVMRRKIYIASTAHEISGKYNTNLGATYRQYEAWPIQHARIFYSQGWPSFFEISMINDSVIAVTDTLLASPDDEAFTLAPKLSTDTTVTFLGSNPEETVTYCFTDSKLYYDREIVVLNPFYYLIQAYRIK